MADYVISDWHFATKTILLLERDEFETLEAHDNYLVKCVNSRLKEEDTLYFLGDIGYDLSRIGEMVKCKKIMIKGNHDRGRYSTQKLLDAGFDEVYDHPLFYNKFVILSHEPIPVSEHFINIHGHLHGAYLDSEHHINVSCKFTEYKPVSINALLKNRIMDLPKIEQPFLNEWYADKYIFLNPREEIIFDENGKINVEESRKNIEARKARLQAEKEKGNQL